MDYQKLTTAHLDSVVRRYVDYYNRCEGGCWTCEKAYKRIRQVLTMEGSECVVQYENDVMTGFLMGYYKEFDDLKAYFLEEIVIFEGHQNRGCGAALLKELEKMVRANGAEHIELLSVNDEHHAHFYQKLGFFAASNLTMMGKHFK